MKQYVVTAPFISVNAGAEIELSLKQFLPRKFALTVVKEATEKKNGVFQVNLPFHLKRGEIFGYDGPVDKSQADAIMLENEYANQSVRETVKDMRRHELVEYAERYCRGLKLDLTKDNDFIRDQIVIFKEGVPAKAKPVKPEPEPEPEPEPTKTEADPEPPKEEETEKAEEDTEPEPGPAEEKPESEPEPTELKGPPPIGGAVIDPEIETEPLKEEETEETAGKQRGRKRKR